ncbi:MAG: DUF523 domain-containing protein [Syntrophomonas sp.]
MSTLISACLTGVNCKYNGGNNLHPAFAALLKTGIVVPICPEQLGGLSTPRISSEIVGGTGLDVLEGRARVITRDNQDVTEIYIKGAYETLNIARKCLADLVILKNCSPSCGEGKIYDGTFTRRIVPGDGVTAALLKDNGITVISDEDFLEKQKQGGS